MGDRYHLYSYRRRMALPCCSHGIAFPEDCWLGHGQHVTKKLVADALLQAIGHRRPSPGLLHHSDRGSQYASHQYQGLMKKSKFEVSMSRKGECYDNVCMESFFHILKVELVYLTRYQTRAEAKQNIFEYIEAFYNQTRLHSALGYISPCAYERSQKAA